LEILFCRDFEMPLRKCAKRRSPVLIPSDRYHHISFDTGARNMENDT